MKNVKTVNIGNGIKLSGYENEYILSIIEKTNDFYEQNLLDNWVAKYAKEAKVIYDIGANIGNHTVYFAKKLNAEKIYSFEPMSINYKMLEKNIADNNIKNVKAYNIALGAENSSAKMLIEQENNNGTAKINNNNDSNGETVKVVTMDSLNLPLPDFIKIDVEGFELDVLKGMINVLKKSTAPIWIEIDEETCKEVYSLLLECGYGILSFNLENDNNFMFSSKKELCDNNMIIRELLTQVKEKRKIKLDSRAFESKYIYEQKKCEEQYKDIQKLTSKFQYEQNVNKEQYKDIQKLTSKFQYEQKLVLDLKETLKQQEILSRKRIDSLKEKNLDLEKEIKERNIQITKFKNLSAERQRILEGYNTSVLFRILKRYWSLSTKLHGKAKKTVYKFGNWTYYKLSKYPRIRKFCSKINGKLKIFKNPNDVVAPQTTDFKNNLYNTSSEIKFAKDLNVAMLVDNFTYNSFKYECNPYPIEPSNWLDTFRNNRIDIFFCESAWSGVDSEKRPWKGQVYSSINFQKENRTVLLSVLKYCKENNIPTVFWNKEDPTHYTDKVHNFVDTAIKFDHIFTTSIECVKRYKEEYGHKSVHLLMFATQPKLFNPINKFERTDEIIFAGSWYNQHKIRCEEMEMILDKIIDSGYKLKIYNRYSKSEDPNHFFPERYRPYLNPCLSHDKLDIAYKGSKAALNINTVVDSETMFARRVFELMSSNTLVISNYSKGMERLFGDNVYFIEKDKNFEINDIERKCHNALYDVLKNHTYETRFRQILDNIDFKYKENDRSVSFIYNVFDKISAQKAYNHFMSVSYRHKKAVFIVDGNDSLREILFEYQSNKISVVSKHFIENYKDILTINTPYFIWTDWESDLSFIQKAILHFSYIENDIAIFNKLDSFKIESITLSTNMLCNVSLFELSKKVFLKNEVIKIDGYGI